MRNTRSRDVLLAGALALGIFSCPGFSNGAVQNSSAAGTRTTVAEKNIEYEEDQDSHKNLNSHDNQDTQEAPKTHDKGYSNHELEVMGASGNTAAKNRLGARYAEGRGYEKDLELALKYFESAANGGNRNAMLNCGRLYKAEGALQNPEKAFEQFRNAANPPEGKGGLWDAMCELSLCYMNGFGTEKNVDKGFECLKEAYEDGSLQAGVEMARCYELGVGCEKDPDKAYDILKKLYRQKNSPDFPPECAAMLGRYYLEGIAVDVDRERGLKLLNEAAGNGNAKAMNLLAKELFEREVLSKEDNLKMFELAKKSAALGDSEGKLFLAELYRNNKGEAGNASKAYRWARKCAREGNPGGMLLLSECYRDGVGTDKNEDLRLKWLREAVLAGNEEARKLLNDALENGGAREEYKNKVRADIKEHDDKKRAEQ